MTVPEVTRSGYPRLATIGLILLAIILIEMCALHFMELLQE